MANPRLIISREDLAAIRPMSKEIPLDRITPFIQEAQLFDLKKLLGDPFYLDFVKKFDQSADPNYQAYQDLLNGVEYTNGSSTVEHPGLIGFIAYSTLIRVYNNPQILTRYGLVTKKTDGMSEQLDTKEIAITVAELRSCALSLQADIIKFLTAKGSMYPLYFFQDGSALGQTGVKFFDVNNDCYPSSNGRTLTSW